jgi:hypothetical protein
MRAAKDAINVALTGEERWPGMCAKTSSENGKRREAKKKKFTHAQKEMAVCVLSFFFFFSTSAHIHIVL